jgi:branched-subunit amino acid aminotransferase/4-amino-4-deoxychorismate lyase
VTALIETVRVRGGSAPLWYLHLRRLAGSCRALGIPLPGELLTPEGGPDRVHRLEVSRRGLEVSQRPVPEDVGGVSLVIARERHRPYPHKTTDRRQFDRALDEAGARGADDALLLTAGGDAAECAIWAVFWWEDGRVCGPPLELGVLPSVARARVDELTGGIQERRAGPERIRDGGMFLGNAVRGLVPVRRLEGDAVVAHPSFPGLADRFWS